ncbi:hypothetical protein XBKB1_4140057 [Xenorhabdus bovienii str. kraussei Becker Underwood]|uniref:Uncharacterized protein n=1 Tax=Xenorhabdus bovienii str. kraussei Becker Underwood TaxID=1398204 RepID=A0A077Q105_XENBV|nr:hypothetical protein XBKB1_4140057 [Xenorhabdus bovienii str. kraussei Becker Underwood]
MFDDLNIFCSVPLLHFLLFFIITMLFFDMLFIKDVLLKILSCPCDIIDMYMLILILKLTLLHFYL